mmetsp:Transcript_31901/g.44489  ORF Transcript_31901/g.44489 Transcript_31901/m.44489 type:complete len:276 (+) Transcript_31901:131-958(+)
MMRTTANGLCSLCIAISVSVAVTLFGAILSPKTSVGISQALRTQSMPGGRTPMAISPTRQMLPLAPPRRTIASRDSEVLMRRREVAVDAKKKTKVWGALRQAARASPSSKWIPRTEEMDFQVIGDHEKFTAEDVVRFIHDWFIRYPDSEVHIGADSKKRGGNTAYVVGICLYHKGQGGTVLYHRKVVPSVGSNLERLWIELEIAMEVSNYVRREIGGELGEEQKISVHIDYNPEPMYKVSNALYSSGMAWIKSAGFTAIAKPDAWAASSVADRLT